MKRRFLLLLAVMSAIVMCIAVLVTSIVQYNYYLKEVKSEIAVEARLMATQVKQADDPAKTLTGGGFTELKAMELALPAATRITLVAKDGTVLYDNMADPAQLENHGDRQEVKNAFAYGEGQDTRVSETLGMDTYYYAVSVGDDAVLRISKEMDQMSGILIKGWPVVAAMMALFLLLSLGLANAFTNRIIRPLYQTLEQIKGIYSNDREIADKDVKCYEEITPFIREIRSLNRQTKRHLEELQTQRDTIDNITKNMAEGLVLLDNNRRILAVNQSAKRMLGADEGQSYLDENILRASRSLELQQALDTIAQSPDSGATISWVEERNGSFCRYFASPAQVKNRSQGGAMIFILDVTAEMKTDNMRREFAANVSHELKTPLTAINGFAELLENGMVQKQEEIKHFATLIHKEASRLISLLEDIMRLSQIENNTSQVQLELVSLPTLAKEAVESLQTLGQQKDVAVAVDNQLPGGSLSIKGSPAMLYELIYNLGENAIKYNKPGGRVDIRLQQQEGNAVIQVADTGIGIPAEHVSQIFQRFYRVDKSRSKATGGTGLGLSIVKHIVEYHGGTVSVESQLGKGTTFTAKLPLQYFE